MDFKTPTVAAKAARYLFVVTSVAIVLGGCGPKPLSTEGLVRVWLPEENSALESVADGIDGLSIDIKIAGESWLPVLQQSGSGPDLIFTEWGREVAEGQNDGELLDITPYHERMITPHKLRPVFANLGVMLPAAAHTWGLFYNQAVLDERSLAYPETWEQFTDSLEILAKSGVTPIALGASFGWPALAWISYVDLRLHGGEQHLRLLDGARSFGEPSITKVYQTIEEWRTKGYFSNDAAKSNWPESLAQIASGAAAYALMDASYFSRVPNRGVVKFGAVPVGASDVDRGEIVAVSGFVVSANSKVAEPALALADAYVATGGFLEKAGESQIAALLPTGDNGIPNDSLAATQSDILGAARVFVPQMDRFLPAQASYDINRVMTRFFQPGSGYDGATLAQILEDIRP